MPKSNISISYLPHFKFRKKVKNRFKVCVQRKVRKVSKVSKPDKPVAE